MNAPCHVVGPVQDAKDSLSCHTPSHTITPVLIKYVNSASFVDPVFPVPDVINPQPIETLIPVGARLQNHWPRWLDLGACPRVVQILKHGYVLPFQTKPVLSRIPLIDSVYQNMEKNQHLKMSVQGLMIKEAIEPVSKSNSLGFYNRLFLVPKPNNQWRPILDLSTLNTYLKTQKFKMETPSP